MSEFYDRQGNPMTPEVNRLMEINADLLVVCRQVLGHLDGSTSEVDAVEILKRAIEKVETAAKPSIPQLHESARPCGCDPGANYVCEWHQTEQAR